MRREQPAAPGRRPGPGAPAGIDNRGKPDAMRGFRPGPGNTGSLDGRDETGRRQVNHEV